jgi:Phage tail tube protein, GTA-gp10
MAVNGEVELTWGDGEHKFNIARLKCLLELEEKCGVGVFEIYQRILNGKWKINDLRETLRLGLIGGGMTPDKALRLINRYCDDQPWVESILPAQAILGAAMFGVPGDDLAKKAETERAKEDQSTEPTVDSPAPSSTDSAPPSDSPRAN